MTDDSTTLKIVANDEEVRVTFTPSLSAQQQDDLLSAVNYLDPNKSIVNVVEELASNWGREMSIRSGDQS